MEQDIHKTKTAFVEILKAYGFIKNIANDDPQGYVHKDCTLYIDVVHYTGFYECGFYGGKEQFKGYSVWLVSKMERIFANNGLTK